MTELLDSYGAVLLENKPDEMKTLLAEVVKSSGTLSVASA